MYFKNIIPGQQVFVSKIYSSTFFLVLLLITSNSVLPATLFYQQTLSQVFTVSTTMNVTNLSKRHSPFHLLQLPRRRILLNTNIIYNLQQTGLCTLEKYFKNLSESFIKKVDSKKKKRGGFEKKKKEVDSNAQNSPVFQNMEIAGGRPLQKFYKKHSQTVIPRIQKG